MSIRKPEPLLSVRSERVSCPVCQQTTYSAGGIHPQCASKRAAAAIDVVSKASAPPPQPKSTERPHWLKSCPKCNREMPVRRGVCDCGHSFLANKARSTTTAY